MEKAVSFRKVFSATTRRVEGKEEEEDVSFLGRDLTCAHGHGVWFEEEREMTY